MVNIGNTFYDFRKRLPKGKWHVCSSMRVSFVLLCNIPAMFKYSWVYNCPFPGLHLKLSNRIKVTSLPFM